MHPPTGPLLAVRSPFMAALSGALHDSRANVRAGAGYGLPMARVGRCVGVATWAVLLAAGTAACGQHSQNIPVGSAHSGSNGDPSVGESTVPVQSYDIPAKPLRFVYDRPSGGEDACLEIDFRRPPSKNARSDIRYLVGEWYDLGDLGAYGNYLTGLFPQKSADPQRRLVWDVNTDLVGPAAFLPLVRALQGYASQYSVSLSAVRVFDPPVGGKGLSRLCSP
jgi:hypothetical protein